MRLFESLQRLNDRLDTMEIRYEPQRLPQQKNEIYIGEEVFAYYTDQPILLEQQTYRSTAKMINRLPTDLFEQQPPAEQVTYYFEDLSPDACLTFILYYCRCQGVISRDFPYEWIDYVERWEWGDVKSTGKPFESWGCLHSALAHAYFIENEQISPEGEIVIAINQNNVIQGLKACLRLAISLLIDFHFPYKVPELDHVEEYNLALRYLKIEYQKYLLSSKRATKIQLELPLRNSSRTVLVDAFINTENTSISLLKSFLLHDEEQTWLKAGFQFFALYQPELLGSGRNIVIQIDSQLNVHLRDLWERLEQLESTRSGGRHRSSKERWINKDGRYQLIISPEIDNDSLEGSKVDWSDVINLIWELYNPASSITVNPYLDKDQIGVACRVYECQPLIDDEKVFLAVKWNSLGQQQGLVTSPTLQRYLTVCLSHRDKQKIPPIYPLPSEKTFDFLEFSFGYGLIHSDGVYLLDDWNNEELAIDLFQREIESLLKRLKSIRGIHQDCKKMIEQVQHWLENDRTLSTRRLAEVNSWISKKKIQIRRVLLETMLSSSDYDVLLFRETVEKHWALHSQLNELYETVSELEQIINNQTGLKTNRLMALITIFGFPVALFSGLFEIIFANLPGPKWFGIHWSSLFLFFGLSLLSIAGLMYYLRRSPSRPEEEQKEIPSLQDTGKSRISG